MTTKVNQFEVEIALKKKMWNLSEKQTSGRCKITNFLN